jgi:formylglycine-generating enzyme required for sulfatase activity
MPTHRRQRSFAVLFLVSCLILALTMPQATPAPVPRIGRTFTNSIGMKLVRVPPGRFVMGSPAGEEARQKDESLHQVEISRPFYLGIHEVTQAQYRKVMGENPSHFSLTGKGKGQVQGLDTGNFPVERVSWQDAVAFCKALTARPKERAVGRVYRLPTEAEWEYACREAGKSTTTFHFGNTLTSDQANFDGNAPYGTHTKGPDLGRTTPVGSYQANALGVYDMHGNVYEWCSDRYDQDYYAKSPRTDPTGPRTGKNRVLRGGCWAEKGFGCRAASRDNFLPDGRMPFVGFRVVCIPTRTP